MEPPMEPMNERMHILEMIEQGRITAEEGLSLLQALNAAEEVEPDETGLVVEHLSAAEPPTPPVASIPTARPETASFGFAGKPLGAEQPEISYTTGPGASPGGDRVGAAPSIRKWKLWWMVPLWVGVAVAIFGGLFMYLAMQEAGIGFWFACAAVPFVLGLLVIVLAWQSREAPWLHLRVQQPPGRSPERIAFSFPLPLRQATWFMRTFGDRIPGMQGQSLDQLIQALGTQANPENPIVIQVDESGSGEKVEIYIG